MARWGMKTSGVSRRDRKNLRDTIYLKDLTTIKPHGTGSQGNRISE
jgi:hypothetical protein